MAFYLASDGINDYVQLDSIVWVPNNTKYKIEYDFNCPSATAFGARLSGVIGSNSSRVIVWNGNNPNVNFPVGTIATAGGFNILNRHRLAVYKTDSINGRVSVDDVQMAGGGANGGGLSFNILLTELSATNSRNPVNLYSLKVWINDVLAHFWNPSNRSLGDNILVDEVGGNHGTLINFPADGSHWVYYAEGEEPAGHAVELSATATLQLLGEKIGQAVAGLNAAAAAAVTANKIAQAQLDISASAATSLTANKTGQSLLPVAATSAATLAAKKIGFGTASINANADINLIAGNVIIVEATISFNAAASIGLSGQKCGAGSVAFLSAANSQLSASKTGHANVNLTAGSLASLSANKIGAAAASLQCAVVHSLLSSKTGYSSFTVPVSISITLNGLSAATKPVARAVFINTRSQQKSLLSTSSEQQRRITTHSRQRYSLQSGGVSV